MDANYWVDMAGERWLDRMTRLLEDREGMEIAKLDVDAGTEILDVLADTQGALLEVDRLCFERAKGRRPEMVLA